MLLPRPMCPGFLADQRGDRSVVRLADRESGLSARTIARRLSSVTGPVCLPGRPGRHASAGQSGAAGPACPPSGRVTEVADRAASAGAAHPAEDPAAGRGGPAGYPAPRNRPSPAASPPSPATPPTTPKPCEQNCTDSSSSSEPVTVKSSSASRHHDQQHRHGEPLDRITLPNRAQWPY